MDGDGVDGVGGGDAWVKCMKRQIARKRSREMQSATGA